MKRRQRSRATVCVSFFASLLTASCPEANAFGFSIAPSAKRPTATATAGRCTASPATASAVDPAEGVDGAREREVQYHDDDEGGGEHDDFDDDDDDDDVHPSVAWLYPAASPTTNRARSIDGRDRKTRKLSRRTLCVDYGTRRVGLAIGVGISPRTVPGITNRGSDLEVARQVLVRARGEGIRDIVVGLPLDRNGTETAMCEIVRGFASVLADVGAQSRPPAGVFLWDERFSSAQAGAMLDPYGGGMSSKVEIDSLAASLILEHFFEDGGADIAEKVEPSTGVVPLEILEAAGRKGEAEEGKARGEEREEDAYGEGSRRRFQEMREESARSTAAGEDLSPRDGRSRKRRRRR